MKHAETEARIVPLLREPAFPAPPVLILNVIYFALLCISSLAYF